jgi:fusion and transport protein UGO1
MPPSSSRPDFRASARDIFSDLDYETYLPERDGSSVAEMAKRLADQALWNYTSVLLAQPFEVAKIVLQCHLAGDTTASQPLILAQPSRRGGAEKSYFDGSHHDVCESSPKTLEVSILKLEM